MTLHVDLIDSDLSLLLAKYLIHSFARICLVDDAVDRRIHNQHEPHDGCHRHDRHSEETLGVCVCVCACMCVCVYVYVSMCVCVYVCM